MERERVEVTFTLPLDRTLAEVEAALAAVGAQDVAIRRVGSSGRILRDGNPE